MAKYLAMSRAKLIREFKAVSLRAIKVTALSGNIDHATTRYSVLTETSYTNIYKVFGRLQVMVGFLWHEDINLSDFCITPAASRTTFQIEFTVQLLQSHATQAQKLKSYKRANYARCQVSFPERRK